MNSRMTHGAGNKEFFKSAYLTAKTLARLPERWPAKLLSKYGTTQVLHD